MNTLPDILTFGFLLTIFLIVFVILGIQFFSGAVYLDENNKLVPAGQGIPPLQNFENLYNASTTVFAVMMVSNWS